MIGEPACRAVVKIMGLIPLAKGRVTKHQRKMWS